MFGKKENEPKIEAKENYQITTIPGEFYGGQNPIIKFKNIEKSIGPEPKKVAPPVIAPTNKEMPKSIHLFSNRTFLFSVSGVLLLIFMAGAAVYYWRMNQRTGETEQLLPPPKIELPPVTENQENPVVVPSSTPEVVTPTTTETVIQDGKIEFPSILLRKGDDMDNDGLFDQEEELFGADPGKPDTDSDGYDDYTEIYNLYSPADYAPARLLTTGKVKDYVNPMFNYKVYYPSTWAVGNVDQEYRDVLFSNITGDNIEVRVFDRTQNQTFDEWFAKEAPGERSGSLMNFVTMFKSPGLTRTDNLVYYFEDPTHFYVIVYHTTNSEVVNFKNVILMMARSFRFNNVDETLPEQKVLISTSTVE